MRISAIIYFLCLTVFAACCQSTLTAPLLKTACDCKDAIPLNVLANSQYGPSEAPGSCGGIQEIRTTDMNSEVSFAREHITAWYVLNIQFDGDLSFSILPSVPADDYDFLLYPYKDSGFCSRLLKRMVTPVRGNLSCNTPLRNRGATGLCVGVMQSFHQQGPGEPFSGSLKVKKGEKYMLVLDNVSPNGNGHTIYFHNLMQVTIDGVVVGSEGQAIIANVNLADSKGTTVEQTTTDTKGKYIINTNIEPNKNYNLTFTNDSSFIGTRTINTAELKGAHIFSDIKTVLPKLKKGAKYPLGNINFYGNEAILLPQSIPSVEALSRLMQLNKKLVIQIEGHVNAADMEERALESAEKWFQNLSEDRAMSVLDYLVQRGISRNRITTIGLAAKQMLFPNAKNEQEASANRRVEIKVISVQGE